MIVRMWHGRVPTSQAKAYREFTNGRAILITNPFPETKVFTYSNVRKER